MSASTGGYRLPPSGGSRPNVMRRERSATVMQLRGAVDCLPRATRIAMLEGIHNNPIIVGAYTGPDGICPMLAAHRAGGRTNFITFARAWDRFAFRGARVRRARRASERELLILRTQLEASLLEDECPNADLGAAMAEHQMLAAGRRDALQTDTAAPVRHASGPIASRPGDPDRSRELRGRRGWRWMRVVRSLEDYERTLAALEAEPGPPREAPVPAVTE